MPKRMRDYAFEDWKRLRPLTQCFKTIRYDALNRSHIRRPARAGDVHAIIGTLGGRRVFVTIAFNDPQAIRWQVALLRRFVPHDQHVIADNSSDNGEARKIAQVAASAGRPYVRLPDSGERSSRGHGLALNWVWRNLIAPGEPAAFGFLDDDFFPTEPNDPFSHLETQDFYGLVRPAGDRWFLWAGFCLFRFAAVRNKPLDFRQDWFIGLDTGGRNWDVLYRDAELSRLRAASFLQSPYRDDVPVSTAYVQWIDGWLHEVGDGGHPDIAADKRAVVAKRLTPLLPEE